MDPDIQLKSRKGRWVLLATVLGSGVAFLDATVVNVALPTIGTELLATVAQLQWIVNAYTLTLAGLILLGGSLGDTPAEGVRALFVMNQEDGGFDCPRCAWPDDASGLHLDICENGVTHVTWVRHRRLQHAKRSARHQAPRSPDHPSGQTGPARPGEPDAR